MNLALAMSEHDLQLQHRLEQHRLRLVEAKARELLISNLPSLLSNTDPRLAAALEAFCKEVMAGYAPSDAGAQVYAALLNTARAYADDLVVLSPDVPTETDDE